MYKSASYKYHDESDYSLSIEMALEKVNNASGHIIKILDQKSEKDFGGIIVIIYEC